MSTDADAGPVGACDGIGPRVAVFNQRVDELVDQVRMRAAMSAALDERQVVGVFDGLSEPADRFGEQVSVIGDADR